MFNCYGPAVDRNSIQSCQQDKACDSLRQMGGGGGGGGGEGREEGEVQVDSVQLPHATMLIVFFSLFLGGGGGGEGGGR